MLCSKFQLFLLTVSSLSRVLVDDVAQEKLFSDSSFSLVMRAYTLLNKVIQKLESWTARIFQWLLLNLHKIFRSNIFWAVILLEFGIIGYESLTLWLLNYVERLHSSTHANKRNNFSCVWWSSLNYKRRNSF